MERPGAVLLAPLRIGAGLKGKIVDAWTYGIPVVTTPIGAEGLSAKDAAFGGCVVETIDDFVERAIELATTPTSYEAAVHNGQQFLQNYQNRDTNWNQVWATIESTAQQLSQRRQSDYTRAMLWHHSNRSTEYFSRWIELKNKHNSNPSARKGE